MYRVGILLKNGKSISKNLSSKEECDTWILETMEKEDIKRAVIVNKEDISERYIEQF